MMKTIDIHGQTGHSQILVGESLANLTQYIDKDKTIIITDSNIKKLYGNQLPTTNVITIGTGEKIKTLATVESIYQQLVNHETDRSWTIVGIGGGIVCDITGFVASTYLRGLDFGFVSTSLLSQVDASVGGKNGVNFNSLKNMIGVFNQPRFVICDPHMLRTLPPKEYLSGFGEIIKHGAIADETHLAFLENHLQQVKQYDDEALTTLIHASIAIKANVVEKDEKEQGERRKLNFGHTLGHAVENTVGLTHGEAVAIGMVFAAKLSVKRGLLSPDNAQRLERIIAAVGLPTTITFDKEPALRALKKDKKRAGAAIHFVLLTHIGRAVVEEIPISQLEDVIDDMC